MSDILSTFFTFVSGHRPTPNSGTREGSGSRPGSVSCTAFSTVFTDTKEMHQGSLVLVFCTLGITLGPVGGVEFVLVGSNPSSG